MCILHDSFQRNSFYFRYPCLTINTSLLTNVAPINSIRKFKKRKETEQVQLQQWMSVPMASGCIWPLHALLLLHSRRTPIPSSRCPKCRNLRCAWGLLTHFSWTKEYTGAWNSDETGKNLPTQGVKSSSGCAGSSSLGKEVPGSFLWRAEVEKLYPWDCFSLYTPWRISWLLNYVCCSCPCFCF